MGGAFRGVGRITVTVLSSHPGPPSIPGNVDNSRGGRTPSSSAPSVAATDAPPGRGRPRAPARLSSETEATQLLRIPLPFLRDLDPQVQVHLAVQQTVDLGAGARADVLQT